MYFLGYLSSSKEGDVLTSKNSVFTLTNSKGTLTKPRGRTMKFLERVAETTLHVKLAFYCK